MSKLHDLHQLGQSTWLNYMRRAYIQSGDLRQHIKDGIQGVTANAAVFENTISNHADYDSAIRDEVRAGTSYERIHEALMMDDVQRAADLLHPVYEASEGLDGYASLELDPSLADDAVETVATARHLLAGIDRGNAMVEVPATRAGCEAIRQLTADGVCVNATHIFAVSVFERVAQAYVDGLEAYVESHSVWRMTPSAVASFSLSPIDKAVDSILAVQGHKALQGQTAIALAILLYARYNYIFSGPRWEQIAGRGARPLRPKWTRILPATDDYPAAYYANALIGPQTVLTFTPQTLEVFQREGRVKATLDQRSEAAQRHIDDILEAGIDLDEIVARLQAEHLAASVEQYQSLIKSVTGKLYAVGASDKS